MKNHSAALIIFFLFFAYFKVEAQELPEIIPPSPTVANLMKFEEVPVSYYTGQPDISIPIYSKTIAPKLAMNIGLSYSTSGVKVTERSGWVGTGWNLMAGGSIGRTMMDIPDEIEATGDMNYGKQGVYQNGYYNYTNMNTQDGQKFRWRSNRGTEHFDTQPDLYQFNFMGNSGRFVIVKDGSSFLPKFISDQSKLKIEIIRNTDGQYPNEFDNAIKSFIITDTNGYKFYFEEREKSYTENISTTKLQDGTAIHKSINSAPPVEYISAWHLTKITTSNDEDLLTLAYHSGQQTEEEFTTAITNTYNQLLFNSDVYEIAHHENPSDKSYNNGVLPPKSVGGKSYIRNESKKPSIISFRDGTSLHFSLYGEHPEYLADINDYHSGCKLGGITVKNNSNTTVDQFSFLYTETNNDRLFLNSVTRSNNGLAHPYIFTYTEKEDLPEFDSKKRDLWGYYKETSTGCIPLPSTTNILTGCLSKIQYPTGGFKEFEFEEHTYRFVGGEEVDPTEIRENYINVNSGGSMTGGIDFSNNSAGFATVTGTGNFIYYYQEGDFTSVIETVLGNTTSNIIDPADYVLVRYKATPPSGFDPTNTNYVESDFTNPLYSGEFDLNELACSTSSEGLYYFKLRNRIGINIEDQNEYIDLDITITHQEYNFVSANKRGGGLRIKSISFTDDSNIESRTFYDYTLREAVPEVNWNLSGMPSSGSYDGTLVHDFSYQVTKGFYVFSGTGANRYQIKSIPYKVFPSKQFEAKMTKGSYVGYKSVTVRRDDPNTIHASGQIPDHSAIDSDIGYTIYEYQSPIDVPIVPNNYIYPFFPLPDTDYKRGLLEKMTVFDKDNKILKREQNTYNDVFTGNAVDYLFHFDATTQTCVWHQFYSTYVHMTQESPEQNIAICSISEGIELECLSYANDYSHCPASTDYVVTPISYSTGRSELIEKKTYEYFYDSNNNQTMKEMRQVFDYNSNNYQIEKQDTYYKIKGAEQYLRTKYFYPINSFNSNIEAVRLKLLDENKVNEVLAVETYRNNNLISESHTVYEDFDTSSQTQMLPKYVKVGKASQTPEERIEFVAYDDYGNPLEVKKTDGTSIVYLYGFSGTLPVAKIDNASYSSVAALFSGNTDFTGNLSVAQETSIRSLTGVLASFYRHDPTKGVTSIVDEKGYQTNYEYDAFNRLKRVKDAQGKILSENTYHYIND